MFDILEAVYEWIKSNWVWIFPIIASLYVMSSAAKRERRETDRVNRIDEASFNRTEILLEQIVQHLREFRVAALLVMLWVSIYIMWKESWVWGM